MTNKKYRTFRRMTEEEQKQTGLPTEAESIRLGVTPLSMILDYDPFIVTEDHDEIPESYKEKYR